jgi:hypothetical protein
MTQNKFWLVSGLNIQRKYETKERAEEDAKELAKEHTSEFGVFELVSSFKGEVTKTVNVIETSFEATPEESLAVTEQDDIISVKLVLGLPYKIGDEVLYQDVYEYFKDQYSSSWENGVVIDIINDEYVKIKNKITAEIVTYELNSEMVKISEPTIDKTATVETKFKVGDRVKIKDGILPLMKDIVDTWEIKDILPLSNHVKLEAPYYSVIVYLNDITHA